VSIVRRGRWWGWGDDEAAQSLVVPQAVWDVLEKRLGPLAEATAPPDPHAIALPSSRLAPSLADSFRAIVAPDDAADDHMSRLTHATGRSYSDLARLRLGEIGYAPDLVLRPRDNREVATILHLASANGVAVVPFGGGTSVTGALTPSHADAAEGVVSLDTTGLAGVREIDTASHLARIGAGTFGPDVEARLSNNGLTLGHFPESFEYSTVGGWIAAASSGQASTGRGAIADLLAGFTCETDAGALVVRPLPARAEGPDLTRVVVGSEGTLGVVTEVTVRVSYWPEAVRDVGVVFPNFDLGLGAIRALLWENARPDIVRLSDSEETALIALLSPPNGPLDRFERRMATRYMSARGVPASGGALCILGFEGISDVCHARVKRALAVCRHFRGVSVGERPGRSWRRRRFLLPYLRDHVMTRGVLAETLETAAPWGEITTLHEVVLTTIEQTLSSAGARGFTAAHLSHAYSDGASLYFTVLARADAADGPRLWAKVASAVNDCLVERGAALSHHHGIGRDRAALLEQTLGATDAHVLRTLRRALDPAGVMNRGAVIPSGR
jgi:alkyldihydroxyacetonephosphate synthase